MTIDVPYFNEPDALLTAIYNCDYDVIIALLNDGRDTEAVDENGNTAIICASDQGSDAIVDLLLVAGANVNALNNDGDSALDLAKYAKHERIVAMLLARGATGRVGPSAKEQQEDAFCDACHVANNIKLGMFSRDGDET